MFGYILPDKPEMKIKEFELFRAYYCGICKSMGRNSGFGARMSLNYDAVFLGLFLSSLLEKKNEIKKEGCIANPLKKKPIVKNSKAVDYAADINTLLTYYKLLDDIKDEKSVKAIAVYPLFASARKKARKRYPEADKMIGTAMEEQAALEKREEASIDAAAEPFAKLLGDLFAYGYKQLSEEKEESALRALEWMGYNIGKWIYTLDAFDDIEKDLKEGSYNPFLKAYEKEKIENTSENGDLCPEKGEGSVASQMKDHYRERALFVAESCLAQLSKGFELLTLRNAPIIENIIYLGMEKKMDEIIKKNCKEGCCK